MASLFQARHSIKLKVTLSMVAIFLISLWSLAFYANRILRGEMERLLGDQQTASVTSLARTINGQVLRRIDALEILALQLGPALSGQGGDPQAILAQRKLLGLFFNAGAFVTRTDGTAIASVPLSAGRLGVNYLDRDYISTALNEGTALVGQPVMGRQLKAPIIGMGVPIRDPLGKVIGVVAGVTNLGTPNFLDSFTEGTSGKSGYYLLETAKNRMVITGTDKRRIMQPLPAPGLNPLIDRHIQGSDETGVTLNGSGIEVLASAKRIGVGDWFLVAELPTAEAYAPIHNLQQRLLLATILLTMLVGGLTWWHLRRQLAPVTATAKLLADLTAETGGLRPLPIASQNEIGDMISGFNRLLQTLAQRDQALRDSEQRYRIVADYTYDWEYWVNANGSILWMSPSCERITGYSVDDFLLDPDLLYRICHPEDRVLFMDHVHEAIGGRELHTIEFRIQHRDGYQRWISHRCSPVMDDLGNPSSRRVTNLDCTERKATEKEIQEAQQKLNLALDAAAIGEWEMDIASQWLRRSPRYGTIFGQAEPLPPWSLAIFLNHVHPDDLARVTLSCQQSLSEAKDWRDEFRIVRDDNLVRWIWATGHVVRNPEGRPEKVVGMVSDITERKAAEAEIRHLAEDLEQRVIVRTAQLEAANKEMEAFSYSVSHDLRAPLRAVDGFSRALAEDYRDRLDETGKKYISRIRAGTQRMGQLIDDLLKLSRVSRGELHLVKTDLSDLCRKAVEDLTHVAPERTVEVSIQGGLSIWADRHLLQLVVENLLGNAWKFTSRREGARIEVGETTTPSKERAFFIKDNGAGFDMGHADKLFNAFQRLHPSSEFEGTGIGLAIANRVIHRHVGRIWAEAEPGNGATFFFTLPD